jgi:alpha-L-rhamnosidase
MKNKTLPLLTFFISISIAGTCQDLINKINPDLFEKKWQAHWIFHPEISGTAYGVYHFRKTIELDENPDTFIIHVSADNRYRLYVNGNAVCFGPARGDILNWRYETLDIASHLNRGKNVIAAVVWNFGEFRPVAQFTIRTAFILQGNSDKEAQVNTNSSWKVTHNKGYQPLPIDFGMVNGYYAAGPGDRVDASLYPWNWEKPGFDDTQWLEVSLVNNPGSPRGIYNYSGNSGWNLVPRNIPMMEEKKLSIPEVVRSENIQADEGFLQGTGSLTIPPNTKATVLLDQTHLTIAYPELWVSGGKNSEIKITYAEALTDAAGKKGNRNETQGKEIHGYYDVFEPDGEENRLFRPLWYRTYRFMELVIQTGDEPLIINNLYGVFTAYPFEQNATFQTNDIMLDNIWEVAWRTARLCATETYSDCPYYEQLQYVGDTRLQALISLYVSGDDRLMRNALIQFDDSRIPEGLTMSRYPTYFPQMHPTYSLIWILMVHDHYMLRADSAFTAGFLIGISSVLQWFGQRVDTSGILGKLTWPNYMDAAPGFRPAGAPPGTIEGQSAQITLLFAYALDHAAELFKYHGKVGQATHCLDLSAELKQAVLDKCYDESKKLFYETPDKQTLTQHTNVLAILTDAIPVNEQTELMQKILEDKTLIPSQIYFSFYNMRALKKVGMGDRYLDNLQHWEIMINNGLTTFAERSLEGRSECHAWSAHPLYDFLATVCGIEPAEPGFKSVKIEPHLGKLNEITASMPHPLGKIKVHLTRVGKEDIKGRIELPEHLPGTFIWKGERKVLHPGVQLIDL